MRASRKAVRCIAGRKLAIAQLVCWLSSVYSSNSCMTGPAHLSSLKKRSPIARDTDKDSTCACQSCQELHPQKRLAPACGLILGWPLEFNEPTGRRPAASHGLAVRARRDHQDPPRRHATNLIWRHCPTLRLSWMRCDSEWLLTERLQI